MASWHSVATRPPLHKESLTSAANLWSLSDIAWNEAGEAGEDRPEICRASDPSLPPCGVKQCHTAVL